MVGSDLVQFSLNDSPHAFCGAKDPANLCSLGAFLFELVFDSTNLKRRNFVERDFQDSVRLYFVQRERFHQLHGRVLLAGTLADDSQRLVQTVKDDDKAFQNVNSLFELA